MTKNGVPVMTIVDENYLDERLGQLENVAGWSPRTLSRFETFIRASEDYLLFKVNPLEYARDKHIKEKEACDLFLHASRLGLFDIQWGLVCPMCGDTVESFASLRKVDTHFHCTICELDTVATLDDFIMISFVISPRVRSIVFHHPEQLNILDYWQHYRFNRQWRHKGGSSITSLFTTGLRALQGVAVGAQEDVSLELSSSFLKIFNLAEEKIFTLPIEASAVTPSSTVLLNYEEQGTQASRPSVIAGQVQLHITNNTTKALSLAVAHVSADDLAVNCR
jgi:hypothetical protein